jgi:transcriptional regulator GlxA family with amidase domain
MKMKLLIINIALLFIMNSVQAQSTDTLLRVKNVAILIYDDVELLDFAGPSEVLQLAEYGGKKAFNIYTVGVNENEITSPKFVKVKPQYTIENCPPPDILVLPGGDTRKAVLNDRLISWVNSVNTKAEYMLSVCSGVFFLAKAGILDGKMATTRYLAMDKLITQNPRVTALKGKRFVDNGRIITTEGVSAGIDGALYLV